MIDLNRRLFLQTLATSAALGLVGCGAKARWPIQGSDKGTLRLAFYTDVHARKEWKTPQALARVAEGINQQQPDLVFGGGDFITDGFQSTAATVAHRWDEYMKLHQGIRADLFPVLGNHDLVAALSNDGSPAAENPRQIFLDKMGLTRTYYAFDALGYHFIVLDSIEVTGGKYQYKGVISPPQLAWLQQDLATVSATTPIILLTHIPLFTGFYNVTQGVDYLPRPNRAIVNNKAVLELFSQHHLLLVLQGHLHVQEHYQWRHTTFITGGAVCGKWWRGNWYGTNPGYNMLTLRAQQIDWEYVEYGWLPQRPINL